MGEKKINIGFFQSKLNKREEKSHTGKGALYGNRELAKPFEGGLGWIFFLECVFFSPLFFFPLTPPPSPLF